MKERVLKLLACRSQDFIVLGVAIVGTVTREVFHKEIASLLFLAFSFGLSFVVSYLSLTRGAFGALLALFLCSSLVEAVPYVGSWPQNFFMVSGLLWLLFRRGDRSRFRTGFDLKSFKQSLPSIVVILVPSVGCLIAYFFIHPDVVARFPVPNVMPWVLPFLVLAVALLNGLREELLYRFLFHKYLLNGLSPLGALLVSNVVFGFIHYENGFPQGGWGVFLTGLFGLALGIQFYVFRSKLATWLTHSAADGVMFAVVILSK